MKKWYAEEYAFEIEVTVFSGDRVQSDTAAMGRKLETGILVPMVAR